MNLHHVGIAVGSIDEAIGFYTDTLGLKCVIVEISKEQGVRAAWLSVGQSHIELLEPLSEDTPVGKFIAHRGEGIHHICLEIEDMDAKLAELRASHIRLIDASMSGDSQMVCWSKVAFVHPSSTRGVLIELAPQDASERGRGSEPGVSL